MCEQDFDTSGKIVDHINHVENCRLVIAVLPNPILLLPFPTIINYCISSGRVYTGRYFWEPKEHNALTLQN